MNRPVGSSIVECSHEHRVALRDSDVDAGDDIRLDERAVDLDDRERVVVQREADRGERARIHEAQAVSVVVARSTLFVSGVFF